MSRPIVVVTHRKGHAGEGTNMERWYFEWMKAAAGECHLFIDLEEQTKAMEADKRIEWIPMRNWTSKMELK